MTKRAIEARRRVLDSGLIACYEIIDRIRKEIAELDRAPPASTLDIPATHV